VEYIDPSFYHGKEVCEYCFNAWWTITRVHIFCYILTNHMWTIQSYFHFKLCQGLIVESAWPVMMLSVFEKDIQKKKRSLR